MNEEKRQQILELVAEGDRLSRHLDDLDRERARVNGRFDAIGRTLQGLLSDGEAARLGPDEAIVRDGARVFRVHLVEPYLGGLEADAAGSPRDQDRAAGERVPRQDFQPPRDVP